MSQDAPRTVADAVRQAELDARAALERHDPDAWERILPELVDARNRTNAAVWAAIVDDEMWAHVVRLLAAERVLTDQLLNP